MMDGTPHPYQIYQHGTMLEKLDLRHKVTMIEGFLNGKPASNIPHDVQPPMRPVASPPRLRS